MNIAPVIVVTRDPDSDTVVEIFGLPPETRTIVLDLGHSFDLDAGEGEESDIADWLDFHEKQRDELPTDHPARAAIDAVLDQVRETEFHSGLVGSTELARRIRGETICEACGKSLESGDGNYCAGCREEAGE